MSYRHTQFAPWILAALLLPAVIAGSVLVVEGYAAFSPLALIFVALAWQFYKLTVEVEGTHVRCFFGPGHIRHTIPMDRILGARPVRNRWWYGWGIRRAPGAWMFNIQGLDAVELDLVGGKRFRIGTDEPTELAAAIRRAIDRAAAR